jgi:hypothetical protein
VWDVVDLGLPRCIAVYLMSSDERVSELSSMSR